jgi:hypothetical protein
MRSERAILWLFVTAVVPLLIVVGATAQTVTYTIRSWTVDGGGGSSSSADYNLSGTIGQHDAGGAAGGGYTLNGGFWPGAASRVPAGLDLCGLGPVLIDAGDTGYEDQDLLLDGCQAIINGAHSFNSLYLRNGATLIHSPTLASGVQLLVAENVTVEAGSAIDLTGLGYAGGEFNGDPGQGPGGGRPDPQNFGAGGGGGYGGWGGGPLGGPAYGDWLAPSDLGSGGSAGEDNALQRGAGGAGGGAIHLVVVGRLTLNGALLADGLMGEDLDRDGGGGSGGSIWIETGQLAGSGQISANGGPGTPNDGGLLLGSSGGGGGRIALYYDTSTFTGAIEARPGSSTEGGNGGAGTIYLKPSLALGGQLIVDAGLSDPAEAPLPGSTPLDGGLVAGHGSHYLQQLDITGQAQVAAEQSLSVSQGSSAGLGFWLVVAGGLQATQLSLGNGIGLDLQFGDTIVAGPLQMDASRDVRLSSGASLTLQEPLALNDLHLSGGSRLSHVPPTDLVTPTLTISATSITVEAGSLLDARGLGYPGGVGDWAPGQGPGGGEAAGKNYGSGGGYGGSGGGQGGGPTYGDKTRPDWLGSGGSAGTDSGTYGGPGGGRVHLIVSDTLALEGDIIASGPRIDLPNARDGGAGSGGSIWIEAGSLIGSGKIRARGGSSAQGGGGGGGRIAFYVDNLAFTGLMDVDGGGGGPGYGAGELGTIWPDVALSAVATAQPNPVTAGEVVSITLLVKNLGILETTVTISNTLPAEVTPNGVQSWQATLPALGGAWTETIQVAVDPEYDGILTNTLSVTATGGQTAEYVLSITSQREAYSIYLPMIVR